MRDAFIIDSVRTPTGIRNGALSGLRPDDILGTLLDHLVSERTGIDPETVEDVICGCVTQIGEQGLNVARSALLAGGLPPSLPGVTVNRLECSGQQALATAAQAVSSGEMDVVIACGVESMSRQPMWSDGFGDHVAHLGTALSPRLFERFGEIKPVGLAAESAAEALGLTRSELDACARRSHELAASAVASGLYDSEIMPLELAGGGLTVVMREDEGAGRVVTDGEMASLAPAFKPDGIITTGNSGKAADGAAALLMMSGESCSRLELTPKARYVCTAFSAGEPSRLLSGVAAATTRALAKAGLRIEDIDVFEINESFSAVPLAWIGAMSPPHPERVNPWGGAIANGDPAGAAGIKLSCTLLAGLASTDGRYGLIATCAGMGMSAATILERIA